MDHLHDANLLGTGIGGQSQSSRVPITTKLQWLPPVRSNCDVCFHTHRTQRGGTARRVYRQQQWLDWAEQLQDMGTLFILLTGGEPMLYPRFKGCTPWLREMGFILTLNTNGTHRQRNGTHLQTHKPRRINVTPVWRQQRNLRTLVPQSARIHPMHGSPETVEKRQTLMWNWT